MRTNPSQKGAGVAVTEPTPAELAVIEAEGPVIAAGVAVVAAECRVAADPGDVVAAVALRRAVLALEVVQRPTSGRVRLTRPLAAAPFGVVPGFVAGGVRGVSVGVSGVAPDAA